MLRLIFAALIIYVVWRYFSRKAQRKVAPHLHDASSGPAEMIACNRCGTFVLKADAFRRSGHEYCSEECARQGIQPC